MVSVKPRAVSGFTNEEAASLGLVPSFMTRQLSTGTHLYSEYIAPPATPTVLPIRPFPASPASTTTPPPSFPTFIDLSNLAAMVLCKAGNIFIVVTLPSPEPSVVIELRSAAKLINNPKSDGLIGEASTLSKTS